MNSGQNCSQWWELSDWQDVARSNGARPGEITRFEESFETGLRTLREAAR
ncbi:hypothetical protein [Rathayibacter rathayi]|nr:hypothetical protein [Rathayibacter rathayi]